MEGENQQKDQFYHCGLVPEDLTEHRLDPGHLTGVPKEAVQQHAQEAPIASQTQGRDDQVLIYDKNVEN